MKQSAIDGILISGAGIKTPNELAEATGYTAEEVVRRTQELLDSVQLTNSQRRAKLIFQLDEVTAEMRSRYKTANDENLARLGNTAAGAVGRVLGELRAMEKDAKDDQDELERVYARQLVRIVEASFNRYLGKLEAKFPELDRSATEMEFQEMILTVAAEWDEV